MYRPKNTVGCAMLLGVLVVLLTSSAAPAANLTGITQILHQPTALGPDRNADFGVVRLEIDSATDYLASASATATPLGGMEADLFGNKIYIASNSQGWLSTTNPSRMLKIPKPTIQRDLNSGEVVSAAVSPISDTYVENVDLYTTTADNPNNNGQGFILGMTFDSRNDMYAAINHPTVGIAAIMRFSEGDQKVSRVVEFVAPTTPDQLLRDFAPDFANVIYGPQSVAFYSQASATNLYYYVDTSANRIALNWAVEDLWYVREGTPGNTSSFSNLYSVPDDNFFTDETRVHAEILAGGNFQFDIGEPTGHWDLVYVPVANRMAFTAGIAGIEGIYLANDLNDNQETGAGDSDYVQITKVLPDILATCLSNVFANSNQILVGNYFPAADVTQILLVTFNTNGTVRSTEVMDLSTEDDALPGRITEITQDSDGTILACNGLTGEIFAIAENAGAAPPPPQEEVNFDCFATGGSGLRLTPASLISYARDVRDETDVITELKLIEDGDLDLVAGWGNITSPDMHFYFVNRPITIARTDSLELTKGDWMIFKSDGDYRAFLEIQGRLLTDYLGIATDYRRHVRYTSAAGFISWLKERGVSSYSDLNWATPTGDGAAASFAAFAQKVFPITPDDPSELANLIESYNYRVDGIGNRSGLWGGIYFNNSDIATVARDVSTIRNSWIEFAESAIYAVDSQLDVNAVRNESALQVLGNYFRYNLVGLSIDGYSPRVFMNVIENGLQMSYYDVRDFGGARARTTPCGLTSAQRFAIGESGTGIYITKRVFSSRVDVAPVFYGNVVRSHQVGVIVQQPAVNVTWGAESTFYRPKPNFGTANGMNSFYNNQINIKYNVRETADGGVASLNHPADMPALYNYWGTATLEDALNTIQDGRVIFDQGEVVIGEQILDEPYQPIPDQIPSSVENSLELYR